MYAASADTVEARADPYLLGRSLPRVFRLDEDDGDEDAWVEERGAMLRVLARLGMEMALDIGAEARAIRVDLEQDRSAREDGVTEGGDRGRERPRRGRCHAERRLDARGGQGAHR